MRLSKSMLCCVMVLSLCGCSLGKSNSETPSSTTPVMVVDETAFQYTPPKVTEVPDEVEPSMSVKTVSLFIQPNYRLDVDVPVDVDYITDNYTYVYAIDSSWSMQILSNINSDNLSKESGVLNPETLTKSVVRSKAGEKSAQQVAKYLTDGKAIVISCYNQPEVFSTALNSLLNTELVEIPNISIFDSIVEASELSAFPSIGNMDNVTVTQNVDDIYAVQYLYSDGSLVVSREIKKKDDVDTLMAMRLSVTIPGAVADEFYRSDNVLYVRYGNVSLATLSLNFNTTISLWAVGEVGRDNLIAFVRGELNG